MTMAQIFSMPNKLAVMSFLDFAKKSNFHTAIDECRPNLTDGFGEAHQQCSRNTPGHESKYTNNNEGGQE
jgi:hypothetical protein